MVNIGVPVVEAAGIHSAVQGAITFFDAQSGHKIHGEFHNLLKGIVVFFIQAPHRFHGASEDDIIVESYDGGGAGVGDLDGGGEIIADSFQEIISDAVEMGVDVLEGILVEQQGQSGLSGDQLSAAGEILVGFIYNRIISINENCRKAKFISKPKCNSRRIMFGT